MLLFSAVLLGLVFYYRISHTSSTSNTFTLSGNKGETGVFYVRLNATYLIFIASWSSSLAPILTACAVALGSYPVARKCLKVARLDQPDQLFTPYQLALTLGMTNGAGIGSLWNWLKYLYGWRSKRQTQAGALVSIAALLVSVTFLGFIVFIADTWLHVTTKTVNFVDVQPLQGSGLPSYGFALSDNCTKTNNSAPAQWQLLAATNGSCSIEYYNNGPVLNEGSRVLSVLNNASQLTTVSTFGDVTPYTYLGAPPSMVLPNQDYTATTFGALTQCRPISKECNLNPFSFVSTNFICSPTFKGDVTLAPWQMNYFLDGALTQNDTFYGVSNPYHMGWAALTNPQGGGTLVTGNGDGGGTPLDPEIVVPRAGGIAFVLACNTTIYDIEYDSVNGTITRFVTQKSNNSVANIAQLTSEFMMRMGTGDASGYPTPGYFYLAQAASLATFSSSAQQLADKMALAYSRAAMSIFTAAVVPVPALAAQSRTQTLVARVSVAPLFTLVLANLMFVILGILLTCVTVWASNDDVNDVQARLSLTGLVADRFEGSQGQQAVKDMEDLFEEYEGQSSARIGIVPSPEGGYAYGVWRPNKA
ncbi:hypothetical protein D6D28_04326 [Aureobasidium pullulans]|uniref:Uncharacterized protein n=1 Tax=Aureobasidium pullulans TaxID=5580 RepID=A0A4S8SLQ2_AURPU|nr:hypothetical protein D6D28_04326 [Aureobasidium pullulans]